MTRDTLFSLLSLSPSLPLLVDLCRSDATRSDQLRATRRRNKNQKFIETNDFRAYNECQNRSRRISYVSSYKRKKNRRIASRGARQ